MSARQLLSELEKLGTAQNRKIYQRHGAPPPLFGVSFANINKLAKKHRDDQALAEALWQSGNADARYLALRVADASAMTQKRLQTWVKEIDHYVLVELLARYVASHSPHAEKLIDRWLRSRSEWISSAGWATLASYALLREERPDTWFGAFLPRIEAQIDLAPNRTRHEMNGALIAIGARSDALAKKATAAAKRIGPVVVDHGETGCKTPEAIAYIAKTRAHRKRKG